MVSSTCPLPAPAESDLQTGFLSLLPMIENHARVYFRHFPCPEQRADKVAETVAVAWQWYRRLAERAKDVRLTPFFPPRSRSTSVSRSTSGCTASDTFTRQLYPLLDRV
jgi:hypothetical protein